jgi:uncharacterized phage protein (TIGR01671 family)
VREIKFRAWDKKIQQFIDAKEIVINDGKVFRNWRDYEDYIPDDNTIELVWFTGLVDKDGTDIFEGDIVRCTNHSVKKNGLVMMEQGMWNWEYKLGGVSWLWDVIGRWKGTVVGNSFENPELLKEDQE